MSILAITVPGRGGGDNRNILIGAESDTGVGTWGLTTEGGHLVGLSPSPVGSDTNFGSFLKIQ